MASHVDFEIFDCDNHYYEAIDAFTRYVEPGMAKRTMQWGEIDGKQRLLVGGKINRFIPNPTFDPISKPGALDEYFRGRNPKGEGVRELFGDLDPMSDHPEYRNRDARLKLMDEQGMQRRDLPSHPRRRHGAGAARRPARAARRVPGLQPVAGGGLGLRLPGAHLRRAHASRSSTPTRR